MSTRRRPSRRAEPEAVAPRRRTKRRSAERHQDRVADARTNVNASMAAATARAPIARQLTQAAYDWRIEADRIDRELAVALQLTGDARTRATKILGGRVDELVTVADKIVDAAFTDTLTPSSALLDRLQHASDRIDALAQAHRELDDIHPRGLAWTEPIRGFHRRLPIPGVLQRRTPDPTVLG